MIQHWGVLGTLLDRRVRRLAKYSRYNRSEKGRTRVERYRASPIPIAQQLCGSVYGPFRIETKGVWNRWITNDRKRERRQGALLQGLQAQVDAYNAKRGIAPRPAVPPSITDDVLRGFMFRLAGVIENYV
jgi:hypothetical protein